MHPQDTCEKALLGGGSRDQGRELLGNSYSCLVCLQLGILRMRNFQVHSRLYEPSWRDTIRGNKCPSLSGSLAVLGGAFWVWVIGNLGFRGSVGWTQNSQEQRRPVSAVGVNG